MNTEEQAMQKMDPEYRCKFRKVLNAMKNGVWAAKERSSELASKLKAHHMQAAEKKAD